jgi:hypothetical protein
MTIAISALDLSTWDLEGLSSDIFGFDSEM